MDLKLSKALGSVKLAMMDTAGKAARRSLASPGCPCRPGCSSCCSRLVFLSTAECLVLQEDLMGSGAWPGVRSRVQALVRLSRLAAPVAWFKMNLACPVLDPESRTCTAYAVRPPACSTHSVRSHPSACDPWSTAPGPYLPDPADDLYEGFGKMLGRLVDGHGVCSLHLPMPVGLLFAERIQVQRGLSAQDLVSMIHNEFRGRA